ncbi:hypothetical protein SAMN05216368_10168 [Cryobacterium flavum]|uniref:ATP-binding protein n=1 Tax=Cryobacterium flavum TaxID=1424659 RepID=A0A4R8V499_9MICO|nr:ATP-binding protein [Cryobacterium flavum]TFB77499.1 ATP-binding protein [Cryobacterium flavum]SDM46638.1 hypothetical protein SAMN05216368_10168 [Cryobacterium flavum]
MDYSPRIVDAELTAMLAGLPAIALDGPKAVGKTATASRRAGSIIQLDDPDQLALLQADRERITRLSRPVLLDEWQTFPAIWDTVRRSVDHDARPGQYILAGSASPTKAPAHSGAGRIVHLRMRPMAFSERQLTPPTVSLGTLLAGPPAAIEGASPLTLEDYASEVTRSGFPAIRLQTKEYRSATLRAWLAAYAAASSTTASYDSIIRAATSGDAVKPSKATAQDYREMLTKLWLLDQVPGWLPSRNRLKGLGQAPKHHLADPALAARLLRVSAETLINKADIGPAELRNGPMLGALFESLVTLSVRVYAQAAGASVHHLRTHGGEHEVDLIIERPDGRVVALEVKLSGTVDDKDTRHLRWLADEIGPDLVDSAVITTGKVAYRRTDGIAVIPLGLLGP